MEDEIQLLGPDERHWDVIILGSGLQETFLAWQLSASSKKVLQLDHLPFYGSSQATLSPSDFQTLSDADSKAQNYISIRNIQIQTSETNPPTRWRNYNLAMAPSLIYPMGRFYRIVDTEGRGGSYSWAAVDGFWTFVPGGSDTNEGRGGGGGGMKTAVTTAAVKARRWNKKRKGGGSGSIESISSIDNTPSTSASAETISSTLTSSTPNFLSVPSSEEAIAFSPHLLDHERATMGLFMRSILSPTHSTSTTISLLDHLSSSFPLRPHLISQISTLLLTHTPPSSTPLSKVHEQLTAHAKSLGSITNVKSAAALTVGYGGLGELCQDWARLVAVNGGLNILERGIESFTVRPSSQEIPEGKGRISAKLTTGEEVTTNYLFGSSLQFPRSFETQPIDKGKTLYRAIYILSHPLTPLFTHQQPEDSIPASSVIYFPPRSLSSSHQDPVYVIARDEGTADCPPGESVLYISTFSSEKEILVEAVKRVLGKWGEGKTVEEVVKWSVGFEQVVGTEDWEGEDGRVVRIGEMEGDWVVREDVIGRLEGWRDRVLREGLEMGDEDVKTEEG